MAAVTETALVVIDVQQGLIRGYEEDWSEVLPVIAGLASRARRTAAPVVLVQHTTRRAASLGYNVELVADGHTTSENGLLSRDQIIAHHNQTLANLALDGVTVSVPGSAEISFA